MSQSVITLCGVKKCGKTTILEKLIPELTGRGLKVAVVKHDSHSFTPDTPGTDTYRFFQAGACGTIIFDGEKYSVTRRVAIERPEAPAFFPDADLILMEGFKRSDFPKMEVIHPTDPDSPLCTDDEVFAFLSDRPVDTERPIFGRSDIRAIADYILQLRDEGRLDYEAK